MQEAKKRNGVSERPSCQTETRENERNKETLFSIRGRKWKDTLPFSGGTSSIKTLGAGLISWVGESGPNDNPFKFGDMFPCACKEMLQCLKIIDIGSTSSFLVGRCLLLLQDGRPGQGLRFCAGPKVAPGYETLLLGSNLASGAGDVGGILGIMGQNPGV